MSSLQKSIKNRRDDFQRRLDAATGEVNKIIREAGKEGFLVSLDRWGYRPDLTAKVTLNSDGEPVEWP